MRILLLGPTGGGGSLPPYLRVFANALRFHGAQVNHVGYPNLPYDARTRTFWSAERVVAAARGLVDQADLTSYDLISVHFGNLEIEQLAPALWQRRNLPPTVYHVHSLDWTLFTTHIPEPSLRARVKDAVATMDAFVYFGAYGQKEFARRYSIGAPSTIAWLPSTIPPGTQPLASAALSQRLTQDFGPVASLYGYAAPWKDAAGLVRACRVANTPLRVVLAGPLWDDAQEAGIDLSTEIGSGACHGPVRLDVVPTYVGAAERMALTAASEFAVFPYKHQSTFQGSGAIADYLANGVPVVGTDIANMAELIGDAGVVVEANEHTALAEALDRVAGDEPFRRALTRTAALRARLFTATNHAARSLSLYQEAIENRPRTHTRRESPCPPNSSSPGTAKRTATAKASLEDLQDAVASPTVADAKSSGWRNT